MRLWIAISASFVMIVTGLIFGSPTTARELVIPTYPADAVIRGENIRLRVEPAEDSADVAILQRGDAIIVTAESTRANGEDFFPVEVVLTGATGWIRALAVDPRSIAASTTEPEVVETVEVVEPVESTEVDRAAEREARRAAREANAEPAAETEPTPEAAAPEADGVDPAADRAARRAARQAEADAEAGVVAESTPATE